MYDDPGASCLTLAPRGVTLMLLLSTGSLHEVNAALPARSSIAGWFRAGSQWRAGCPLFPLAPDLD